MFCRNCGSEIPTGAKFCPECGEALTDTADSYVEVASDNRRDYEKNEVKPKKTGEGKRKLILIIVLAVVAAVMIGLLIYGMYLNSYDESDYRKYEKDDEDKYEEDYDDDDDDDSYVVADDDRDDDDVEEDKAESNKLTFKTGADNSSKKSADDKYYPGTDILTFTEVTGFPVKDEYIDDGTEDGTVGSTTYTYYNDEAIDESAQDFLDLAEKYIDEIENAGFEYYGRMEIEGLGPDGEDGFSLVYRKDRERICMAFIMADEEENTVYPLCYVAVSTECGYSDCNQCSSRGHDTCQGHTCDICGGRGNQTCSGCNGTGLARVPSSYSNKCVVCYGQGTQICPNCKGAGKKFYD